MLEEKKPDQSIKYGRIIPEIVKNSTPLTAIVCARLVSNKRDYHPTESAISYQTNLNAGSVHKALEWLVAQGFATKDNEDGFYPTDLLVKKAKTSGFLVENEILYNVNLLPIQRVLYGHMIYRPQNHGNEELSLYTGLSDSSTRRVKKDLVKAKVLELGQRGKGRNHRNGYKLLLKTHVTEHGWDTKATEKTEVKPKQEKSPELTPDEEAELAEIRAEAEHTATINLQHYEGNHTSELYKAAYDLIVESFVQIETAEGELIEELTPGSEDGSVPPEVIPLSELIEFIDHNTLSEVEVRLKAYGGQIKNRTAFCKKSVLNAAKLTALCIRKDTGF